MSLQPLFKTIPQTMSFIALKLSTIEPFARMVNRNMHHMCRIQYPCNMSNMGTNQVKSTLLQSLLPMYNITCGLKMKIVLHRRCRGCRVMWKNDRKYIICRDKPRHNQVERKKKEYKTWIVTCTSQSKVREW